MTDRDTKLILAAGLLISVLLHLLFMPMSQWMLLRWPGSDRDAAAGQRELEVGRADSVVASVAWIPYDDFRKLMTSPSTTEQPALQQQANPVDDAPMRVDPTPAMPVAPQPEPAAAVGTTDATEQPAALPVPPAVPLPTGTIDADVAASPPALEPSPPSAEADASTAAPGATAGTPAQPTSSPRSDRDSSPTMLSVELVEVHPGKVITGEGIEIKTAHPQISTVARVSTIPSNPIAILTFDPTGAVIEVELTRSTGAGNFDGPIVASLYKWKASGERVEKMTRPFRFEVKLLLVDE